MRKFRYYLFPCCISVLVTMGCARNSNYGSRPAKAQAGEASGPGVGKDSPESLTGERFFREIRFSQYFFAQLKGSYNQTPQVGDPVVEQVETLKRNYPNPYRAQAMSCAACHFVDQNRDNAALGVRAYTDFSKRSRVPDRGDGQSRTVRNSPNMVGSALKDGMFLHADGEFSRPEDLVETSYLGRNMGWFVTEEKVAIHHIAEVVRHDSGAYPTDTDLGGLTYSDLFAGSVPQKFRVALGFRLDVSKASDEEIFQGVVKLVGQYLRALDFSRDADGSFNGSPYDVFLKKNNLPQAPDAGESALQYSRRLLRALENTAGPIFVDGHDGQFKVQNQPFVFSRNELDGLKTFFGAGKCIECHSAPDFSDHLFHNTGVSQFEYDGAHGPGRFMKFEIPTLSERNARADLYLPASGLFPQAKGWLRSVPSVADARLVDLGVWVVFKNPSMPRPQQLLREALCQSLNWNCKIVSDDDLAQGSVALIKTPTVRDLGQSAPYFHNGEFETLESVVQFYDATSASARSGLVRNADRRLKDIQLSDASKGNLVLFLKSLNEDYQ